jgi:hypothetical protein
MLGMKERIETLVSAGLTNLVERTKPIWPHAYEQLLEQNLSFYVGLELANHGFSIVEEFPADSGNRIDLVAFEYQSKTLVLLESKRLWRRHGDKDTSLCVGDMKRIELWARNGLKVWSFEKRDAEPLRAVQVFGIALASSSGWDNSKAKDNLAKAKEFLGTVASEFKEVPHTDGTYYLLYRVWQVESASVEL